MVTKQNIRLLGLPMLVVLICCSVSSAFIWGEDHGAWSPDWPKELEPYRERASTISPHPVGGEIVYTLPFTDRSDFEKIWPVLLSLKSKGAPLILHSGSVKLQRRWSHIEFCGKGADKDKDYCDGWPEGTYPGVKIYTSGHSTFPENSSAYKNWIASHGQPTARIELFVDGKVIDLNRIRLPADTPIIDKRVLESKQQSPTTQPVAK